MSSGLQYVDIPSLYTPWICVTFVLQHCKIHCRAVCEHSLEWISTDSCMFIWTTAVMYVIHYLSSVTRSSSTKHRWTSLVVLLEKLHRVCYWPAWQSLLRFFLVSWSGNSWMTGKEGSMSPVPPSPFPSLGKKLWKRIVKFNMPALFALALWADQWNQSRW